MADMGIGAGFGAGGAVQGLQDVLQQRMQAAQLAQQDALTRLKFKEQADAVAARLEAVKQAEADRQEARRQQDAMRQEAQNRANLPLIPLDQPVSSGTVDKMTKGPGGLPPETFKPSPLVPTLPPQGIAAPDQPPSAPMPGTVANSPAPLMRTFNRNPTLKENEDSAAAAQRATAAAEQHARDQETGRHNKAMEAKQPREPNPQPQIFTGPDGKQHAVQFVGGQSREIPLPAGYSKLSGTVENRLQSATAVTQTGDDIIKMLSDPKVKETLGPALGRYSTVRDFIGNPPPEFSDLAGTIESYALANMGVHGMRSVQGADEIKKLLDAKHTPESLASAVRGLQRFSQHFMENNGRTGKGPAPSATKPSAADLIKKYGGQ